MKKLALAVASLSFVLSGCVWDSAGLRPLTYQRPADTRLIVSSDDCPSAPKKSAQNQKNGQHMAMAPIVTAVLLGAASKLLDNFGNALEKGSEGGNLPASVASANFELVPGKFPQCLIVVRGKFEATDKLKSEIEMPEGFPSDVHIYELAYYIELKVMSSQNKTALTFAPVYTWIARSMDGHSKGSRGLSIAVKFSRLGGQETGSAVLLEDRVIGEKYKYSYTDDENKKDPLTEHFPHEAPWFGSIEPNGEASRLVGGGEINSPLPFTAAVTVVESRPTKEFMAFVASVFVAARPAIDSTLKNAVDPATKLANEKTALDNEGSYGDALAQAKIAVLNYCALDASGSKAVDRVTMSGTAHQLQMVANKAALVAGYRIPFPTLIKISAGAPKTDNGKNCLSTKNE